MQSLLKDFQALLQCLEQASLDMTGDNVSSVQFSCASNIRLAHFLWYAIKTDPIAAFFQHVFTEPILQFIPLARWTIICADRLSVYANQLHQSFGCSPSSDLVIRTQNVRLQLLAWSRYHLPQPCSWPFHPPNIPRTKILLPHSKAD